MAAASDGATEGRYASADMNLNTDDGRWPTGLSFSNNKHIHHLTTNYKLTFSLLKKNNKVESKNVYIIQKQCVCAMVQNEFIHFENKVSFYI